MTEEVQHLAHEACKVYESVLRIRRVDPADDFVKLGGTSLLAMTAARALSRSAARRVDAADILRERSPARLARRLAARFADHRPEHGPGRLTRAHATSYPLSTSQYAVWLLQEMWPESLAYTAHNMITFSGHLEVDRLERSLQTLVDRHEALRAVIRLEDSGPTQYIRTELEVPLEFRQAAESPDEIIHSAVRRRFDLAQGPLIRWMLIRIAADRWVLLQSEHHVIHDGWSSRLLLHELALCYRLGPQALDEQVFQYGDFVRWQQKWLASDDAWAQLDHWNDVLKDAVALPAPLKRRAPDTQQTGASFRLEVPDDVVEALRMIAHHCDTTLFTVALAAFADAAGDMVDGASLNVASGFANRRPLGSESVVGMCVNTVIIPIDLDRPSAAWPELVGDVADSVLAALANQEYPFPRLVAELDPPRTHDGTPYARFAFSMHDAPMPPLDFGGPAVETVEGIHPGSAKFDVNVIMVSSPTLQGGAPALSVLWEWATSVISEQKVRDLAEAWQRRLRAWATASSQRR